MLFLTNIFLLICKELINKSLTINNAILLTYKHLYVVGMCSILSSTKHITVEGNRSVISFAIVWSSTKVFGQINI